jgi:hypothetical protein
LAEPVADRAGGQNREQGEKEFSHEYHSYRTCCRWDLLGPKPSLRG